MCHPLKIVYYYYYSSPELYGSGWAIVWLRMSYCDHLLSVICRRPQLWTTSPLKPLGQFSSNFMWSLLLKEDWKIVQMITVRHSRLPPCPYMVKTLKNLLLQNQESFKAESWYIASRTQGLQSCSNDDPRLTFDLFTAKSNLHPHAFVWGKYWKVIFSKCITD